MTTVLKTKKATALLLHSIVQKGRHRSKPTMSKAGSAEPSTEANKEEDVDHPPNKTESYHCKLDESVRCDSDDGEDDEILEESQDKRWSKRREKVKQRDIPGVDVSYLAMDNETGNEVVWNEVQFSERKNFKEQEEKLKFVFDHLTRLNHLNLVKFHKYWADIKSEKPRIIFITEYMSSGTMFRFLQRARTSGTLLNTKAWKNWTSQILSALNYLHSCDPPIVHANLTCNTIFIQQNGLVKIGCVAPNFIHHHVKTFRENIKSMYYMAPEYDQLLEDTTQADIYSFGICTLEMASTGALQGGFGSNGSHVSFEIGGVTTATQQANVCNHITQDMIHKALNTIEDREQRSFIESCLNPDPKMRPTAHTLVSQLEQIGPPTDPPHNDSLEEGLDESVPPSDSVDLKPPPQISPPCTEILQQPMNPIEGETTKENVIHSTSPELPSKNQIDSIGPLTLATSNAIQQQDLQNMLSSLGPTSNEYSSAASTEASVESNNNGNFPPLPHSHSQQHLRFPVQFERDEGYHTVQSTTFDGNPMITHHLNGGSIVTEQRTNAAGETRMIVDMRASVDDDSTLRICLQLDDLMNRHLITRVLPEDTADQLVTDLVLNGFISEVDSEKLVQLLQGVIEGHHSRTSCDA